MIANVLDVFGANRTAWRRARNLRAGARTAKRARPAGAADDAGARTPVVLRWLVAGGALLALAGMAAIVVHARLMASVASAGDANSAASLRVALPGVRFTVPAEPGITLAAHPGGTLLVASGVQGGTPLPIDLCTQVLDPARPRLLPLRIGLSFDEVRHLVARNVAAGSPATLRNMVMAEAGSAVPHIEITGTATRDFSAPLSLRWSGGADGTRWIGDASHGPAVAGAQGQATIYQQGWMVLDGRSALHVQRRASVACPQAGELVLQLYQPQAATAAAALVAAFPVQGPPVATRLAPGQYTVPAKAPPDLEDGVLFSELRAHGLVRLGPGGLAELAPPDLAAWRAAPADARAGALPGWDGPPLGAAERKLVHRLYREADGDYLREQVRIFNSEHRLLAWRAKSLPDGAAWRAAAGQPLPVREGTPAGAARLFARLPQGWGSWSRVAAWPSGRPQENTTLTLALQRPAGATPLELLLAGRVTKIEGAHARAREDACTGHACTAPDAVQRLVLDLDPGARTVKLTVQPMDATVLTDPHYRHLTAAGGELVWRPLDQGSASASAAAARVTLADRNGAVLWSGEHPSAEARAAGLAPLLGVSAAHPNSVAGMLARLPSASNTHTARLTLDLPLQATAQAALDCIALRRGAWNGHACAGGAAPPAGRQAGVVVLDTDTGDILAAAGAGNPAVDERNWDEVRDFDVANPAESPLRLPAFQHDGGGQRSPGSTFKIVSALGLELAAQHDPQLDALLGGLPLATLDGIARTRGFAFETNASTYPAGTQRAHITNFRNETLGRRAHDGRLGLEQALTYSLNTWFAWTGELSDRTLFGQPADGVPDLQALTPGALRGLRPIADMAARLGFGQQLRLDGGLLPAHYRWLGWDALQTTPAHIDPIHSRHELRQMTIGLRMQATPLQMALVAGAVGQGRIVAPRLLSELDGHVAQPVQGAPLGVRLDRIRAGMKGVVERGTAASVFRPAAFDRIRPGLYGKTGTAPTGETDAAGHELATVWFTGWLEPGTLPGQSHRLAFAVFASRSEGTGGEHAAPVVAALLQALAQRQEAH